MKIQGISDLHGYLPSDLQKCDILCICGDIMPLHIQRDMPASIYWLKNTFYPWCEKQLKDICKNILFIAGNHDFVFEKVLKSDIDFEKYDMVTPENVYYLCDDSIIINNIKFYGSPWCPALINWAFYKSDKDLTQAFDLIDEDTNILLTHCPPQIEDIGMVLQKSSWNYGRDFGCEQLTKSIDKLNNLKLVMSGHIHSGNHNIVLYNNINVVNVSLKDERYNVKYKPFIYKYD